MASRHRTSSGGKLNRSGATLPPTGSVLAAAGRLQPVFHGTSTTSAEPSGATASLSPPGTVQSGSRTKYVESEGTNSTISRLPLRRRQGGHSTLPPTSGRAVMSLQGRGNPNPQPLNFVNSGLNTLPAVYPVSTDGSRTAKFTVSGSGVNLQLRHLSEVNQVSSLDRPHETHKDTTRTTTAKIEDTRSVSMKRVSRVRSNGIGGVGGGGRVTGPKKRRIRCDIDLSSPSFGPATENLSRVPEPSCERTGEQVTQEALKAHDILCRHDASAYDVDEDEIEQAFRETDDMHVPEMDSPPRTLGTTQPMGAVVSKLLHVATEGSGGGTAGPAKALWATKSVQPRGIRKPTPTKRRAKGRDGTRNHHQTTRSPPDHFQHSATVTVSSQRTSPTHPPARVLSRTSSSGSVTATSSHHPTALEVTFVGRMGARAMLHARGIPGARATLPSVFVPQSSTSGTGVSAGDGTNMDKLPNTPDSGTSSAGTFLSDDVPYVFCAAPRSHAADESDSLHSASSTSSSHSARTSRRRRSKPTVKRRSSTGIACDFERMVHSSTESLTSSVASLDLGAFQHRQLQRPTSSEIRQEPDAMLLRHPLRDAHQQTLPGYDFLSANRPQSAPSASHEPVGAVTDSAFTLQRKQDGVDDVQTSMHTS
eukprot:m.572262 g.572262  ORF g.572262 m.572262 type:complete len:648 (-) comp22270_c0_seq1:205-2148(-)